VVVRAGEAGDPWSTIPWSPPMMLVSIVGHASFHTALRNGPSMIERSYRATAGAGGASEEAGAAGTEALVNDAWR
jgi:hypothetical protein